MSTLPAQPLEKSLVNESLRYMGQLIEENDQLRVALVREREQLRVAAAEELRHLREEGARAAELAKAARLQFEDQHAELRRAQLENQELAENLATVQEMQIALSSLYAASHELHASPELENVLKSLQEIVINLLGSESFGIYLAAEQRPVLQLSVDVYLPPGTPRNLEFGAGLIGRSVLTDEPWVEATGPGPEPEIVIPLKVRERVVGAIAIFKFLHRKKRSELDRELFRLLSAQAATALHGAVLYAKEARRASTFEGLIGLVRSGVNKV